MASTACECAADSSGCQAFPPHINQGMDPQKSNAMRGEHKGKYDHCLRCKVRADASCNKIALKGTGQGINSAYAGPHRGGHSRMLEAPAARLN